MSISLICACKNRYNALRVSLNSWLAFNEITEIIIVDWSSDEPLNHLTKLDDRIKIVRVENEKYFNQPQPLNLAASIATGDYILKVDTDYIFNTYYNFFNNYFPDENSFVCGHLDVKDYTYFDVETGQYFIDKANLTITELKHHIDSFNSFYIHLNGLLFVTKENYLKIGGYNENLKQFYAYEDDEIPERLKLLGLNEIKIKMDNALIHLPHPDSKRLENFEGKDEQYENAIREGLSVYHQGEELQWQIDYAMAQRHIELNKAYISEIKDYYVEPKTKWNIIQLDNQNYFAEQNKGKLDNFPTVYYMSLEESSARRKNLIDKFNDHGVANLKGIISKRFAESNDVVTGKYAYQLNDGTKGCIVSHLKALRDWYFNSNEDYAFFCEDDISLETIDYWDFTWNEFMNNLPSDWQFVQLLIIRDQFDTFEIRERYWDDWAASTAYIIKRDYAKYIIDAYCIGNTYHLEIPGIEIMPLGENILSSGPGKKYAIPLLVEDINFGSTFTPEEDQDVKNGQKSNHVTSNESVLNWWKNKNNKNVTENTTMKTELEELITDYSLDTENAENNFSLGIWYESQGHTAPALSYFLRSAERAEDDDLAYESLIRASYCYEKQGTRDGSAKSLLEQALVLLPKRPEAYFLLSRFAERRQCWQDCYIHANNALNWCDFDQDSLRTNIEYPGKYGLLFEKALAAWWWGKTEESKNLLLEIKNNHKVSPEYLRAINDNLSKIGVTTDDIINKQEPAVNSSEFYFPSDFDWGDLSYEDIITIEREIQTERVYDFWRKVEENDVVMDVGASVGPFTCSALLNKAKKIYCVEPSRNLLGSLAKNTTPYVLDYSNNPIEYVNYAIVENNNSNVNIFGSNKDFKTTTFKNIIESNSINKINFLKIDCEGGEYSIFIEENMNFLLNNVEFIAMEVHLNYEGCREKFKNFRDNYLVRFPNYKIMSCTRQNIFWGHSLDIKDRIFEDDFINDYSCEFMIYIKNV
jgi:FkbM family methyltransferase